MKILRKAFNDTMADKAFIEEAIKLKLTVEPISGEQLATIISEIYKTPPQIVQRVTKILGNVSGLAPQ